MRNYFIIKKSFLSREGSVNKLINYNKFTRFKFSFKEPTADTEIISVTPLCFSASILARKFILDGDIKCPLPCLGIKQKLCFANFASRIWSDGSPHGVLTFIHFSLDKPLYYIIHYHQLFLIYS